MKKFLKIFLGILFLALLVGTFVFLWNKTRPREGGLHPRNPRA